jgi:hypothetical protein
MKDVKGPCYSTPSSNPVNLLAVFLLGAMLATGVARSDAAAAPDSWGKDWNQAVEIDDSMDPHGLAAFHAETIHSQCVLGYIVRRVR